MAKKLITPNNVTQYLNGNKLYVDKDMILSPSVKDYFKEKMITVIYGEKESCEEKKCCEKQSAENLKESIIKILEKDFNIYDERLAELILKKIKGVVK